MLYSKAISKVVNEMHNFEVDVLPLITFEPVKCELRVMNPYILFL